MTLPEWHPADINPPWEDEDEDQAPIECLYCGTHCRCDEIYDHWKEREL